jgi:hypothetical protein
MMSDLIILIYTEENGVSDKLVLNNGQFIRGLKN